MKHATTAIAAIIAAAGFAGAVQAQSMTPPGTSPTQNMQSSQYTGQTPSQPYGAQYNPYAAQRPANTAATQQNTAQRNAANPQRTTPLYGVAPRSSQNAMQNPGMAQNGMQASGKEPFWTHPISRNTVREAQQRLAAEGLYRGRKDGLVGTQTEQAIARFQQRNGLRATGTLDEATLDRLVGPSSHGYGASAGQPPAGQPTGAMPMNQGQMNQAPSAGAYPPNGTNTGAVNYGSHAQPR